MLFLHGNAATIAAKVNIAHYAELRKLGFGSGPYQHVLAEMKFGLVQDPPATRAGSACVVPAMTGVNHDPRDFQPESGSP